MGHAGATFMALGAFLVLVSAVPYMINIARGRTRPRIFSWIVWTLLGAIATVAAYTEGEYSSAALTAAATVETGGIVALGWKYGNRSLERLDAWCLVGVTIGLVLWAVFDSPLMGLTAALTVDIIAAVPTVRHAWRKPHEELAVAYALCAVASACFIAAMPKYTLMGLLYPAYLLSINTVISAIIWRTVRPSVPFGLGRPVLPGFAARGLGLRSSRPLAPHGAALAYGRHAASVTSVENRIPAAALSYGRHTARMATTHARIPAPRHAFEDRRAAVDVVAAA